VALLVKIAAAGSMFGAAGEMLPGACGDALAG
jgi:hypothetical protein